MGTCTTADDRRGCEFIAENLAASLFSEDALAGSFKREESVGTSGASILALVGFSLFAHDPIGKTVT